MRWIVLVSALALANGCAESRSPAQPNANAMDAPDEGSGSGGAAAAPDDAASEPGTAREDGTTQGANPAGAPNVPPSDQPVPAPIDLSGRWTSSVFEDPLEARFSALRDGAFSGRVCGPSSARDVGASCGEVTAAWISGRMIHFDFELPWPDLNTPIRYQFVGTLGADGDTFNGVLAIDTGTYPVTFTRCAEDRDWCPSRE